MYHHITIIGRLGRDPEMRYLPSGDPVATFSVAADREWTDRNGQRQRETIWFRVSAFGRLAEVVHEHLGKGRLIFVTGRLVPDESGNPRVYARQDGTVSSAYEVVAETVQFLDRPERQPQQRDRA